MFYRVGHIGKHESSLVDKLVFNQRHAERKMIIPIFLPLNLRPRKCHPAS